MRRGRFAGSSGFLQRQVQAPARGGALAKAYATAARRGTEARAAGMGAADNPYRGTDWHTAWAQGWILKDRELSR